MKKMLRVRKFARQLAAVIGVVIAAASVLIALAVLLAFLTERPNGIDSQHSARAAGAVAIGLFLAAIAIFALEARKPRRIKKSLATAALFCAAGGAVLTWTAFDHAQLEKKDPSPLAKGPTGIGSGRNPGHGGGKAKPQHARAASHGREAPANSEASAGSSGEVEAEASGAAPYSDCYCDEGSYGGESEYGSESKSEEEWGGGEESWEEEGWEEEESWEEEWEGGEESWEEEEWEEEDEGWEEEW